MNKKSIFSVVILFLILSITVGFSAFASEMSIGKIAADVRVKKDIRITDATVTDGKWYNLDAFNYDTDSILFGEVFYELDDFVSVNFEVTNFGNVEMGIYDIEVSEGIRYEITGYELKDKLCDNDNNCNLGSKKIMNLKIYPTGDAGLYSNISVNFDFREMHTITYEGITNNSYPTEIISGSNLNVDFTGDIPENLIIYKDGTEVDSSKYTYSNNTLTFNNVSGDLVIKSAKNLFNIIKLKTNGVDTNIDFGVASSESNGGGVNTISGTENDQYPVYYYRGNVTDNNVKFANFCWKMVRTTDTGGIKLIYNGVPGDDGSCNNTGTASQIGTSAFNSTYTTPADVGYMYGTVYIATSKSLTDQTDTYIYGNDVSWDGTNYTLTGDTMSSSSWKTDYKTLATKYHYTCFNTIGTCTEVYYINYFGNSSIAYYLTLTEGKNIEKAKEEMFTNTTDSIIKTTIDNWYKANMTSYTNKLEDTVWCNDRTLTSGPLLSKITIGTGASFFAAYGRNIGTFKPSISCTNTRDSFTVDSSNGNGKLTYPVGLLTADEYTLAGSGYKGYSTDAYLYTGKYQWSLSPCYFNYNYAFEFYLSSSGALNSSSVNAARGVRPSVSLKPGTYATGGDGSFSTPYIVE